jgi:DNA-binding protein
MKETIDKHTLVYEKSTYGLKLIKIGSKLFYIDLTQIIHASGESVNHIKINPTALPDIIEALQCYKEILDEIFIRGPKSISKAKQQVIQDRYLKGVSIKDIAMQTGKTEELIETILRGRDIEIVPNKLPYKYIGVNVKKKWGGRKR